MLAKISQKTIEWGFYSLFFLVPLVFYAGSYELFEYNKMMLVYALTVIIAGAWVIKGLKNFRRTPLDIPILLYLLSHILSTIFSIDPHTSIWGYYSRFHEGLLATISYIILYYAAASNLTRDNVLKILKLSFVSAAIIAVYGAFEHFGRSPSCLFITGKFDVDCWVQDVKNRVFATLGQPNWMAAYLDVLILVTLGFVHKFKIGAALEALLFAALLFTKSRSGLLGLFAGLVVFLAKFHTRPLLILLSLLLLLSVWFSLPFTQIEKLSLENLITNNSGLGPQAEPRTASIPKGAYIDIGISESSDIRKIVWQGAIKVWQRYPIFGSGVETFAYAYYRDRPVAHNMVSEWDFLYNKAHNEYLNLLATTGTVGFVAYMTIILAFIFWVISNFKFLIPNKFFNFLNFKLNNKYELENNNYPVLLGLFAAWVSILVTNFFGFSVVIIGLFFFLIPAFSFILTEKYDQKIVPSKAPIWLISLICLTGLIMEWNLLSMWRADKAFAYGKNLDSVQRFTDGYSYLLAAVATNPKEPTFRDELSYNQATLATSIFTQIQSSTNSAIASLSAQQKLTINIPTLSTSTANLITEAINNSNKVVETSPNTLTFWKTRTKVFYILSTIDNKYILDALAAIQKAAELAPTDAKVHYNLAILYGRAGQITPAITTLEETIAMKRDYRDAYYALGLYYKETSNIQKAKATMQQILTLIGPDPDATKWLEENR